MTADGCELLCLDLPHAEAVRAALPKAHRSQVLANTAKALADPVRLRTATALALGAELCVCDLAWVVGAAPNLVSHHLRVLRRAGLVTSRRQGKLVMCQLTAHGAALLAVLDVAAPGEALLVEQPELTATTGRRRRDHLAPATHANETPAPLPQPHRG
ncbi:helix-turn-helix transcriptional regulator [Actinotalea sp. Marseille-Q4924]|uniref:ArsR/SmtB family transcription factor n=1 Tax=Actinotalea sp. Marseille-Q4924 TaxID=2866571 RepID=UPI001CE3C49F|nr:metalloregulator ArsR/SmtB family transcription factor [Actinotalea sp. Marseille-Q4924]